MEVHSEPSSSCPESTDESNRDVHTEVHKASEPSSSCPESTDESTRDVHTEVHRASSRCPNTIRDVHTAHLARSSCTANGDVHTDAKHVIKITTPNLSVHERRRATLGHDTETTTLDDEISSTLSQDSPHMDPTSEESSTPDTSKRGRKRVPSKRYNSQVFLSLASKVKDGDFAQALSERKLSGQKILIQDALRFQDPYDLHDVKQALHDEFDILLLPVHVPNIEELGGDCISPLELIQQQWSSI
jgi:hypothetical protein